MVETQEAVVSRVFQTFMFVCQLWDHIENQKCKLQYILVNSNDRKASAADDRSHIRIKQKLEIQMMQLQTDSKTKKDS